ncbi:MAG: hypothetical protein QXK74_08330 [Candidatus Nitrosocaldaceae archaeon]
MSINNSRRVKAIIFFGPDGAGKTTQADMLVARLLESGIRCKKFWLRSPHTLAYLLWRLLFRLGKYRIEKNHVGKEFYALSLKNQYTKVIWSIVEFISIIPHILRFYMLINGGYVVIAERYVIDTIANIAYFIDDKSFVTSKMANMIARLVPKDALLIYLDADYYTIVNRRGDLAEPFTYIDIQRYTYEYYSLLFNSLKISTTRYSKEDVTRIILRYLNNYLVS